MKKVRGKALALVLSLALVVSSFSTAFTSAASRTLKGDLSFEDDTETDEFYFVNGENNAQKLYQGFGNEVGNPILKAPNHEEAGDVKIADISHKSGDHLVKWFDYSDNDANDAVDDSDIEDVGLKLRNASASGEEVLSVLYSGTYTDDDDNEYTVKASEDVTIRVYDKGEVVIGEADAEDGDKGELDDDFAQKTVSHEIDEDGDTEGAKDDYKNLQALRADDDGSDDSTDLEVKWDKLKTVGETDDNDYSEILDDNEDNDSNTSIYYVLSSNSDNIKFRTPGDVTTYTYKDAITSVPAPEAGDPTYTKKSAAVLTGDTATDAATAGTIADAELALTKATSDDSSNWKYYAKKGNTAVDDTTASDVVTLGSDLKLDLANAKLALAEGDNTIAITAYTADETPAKKGTLLVTVTYAAGTVGYAAENNPTIAWDDADTHAALKVTAGSATGAGDWDYSYQIKVGDGEYGTAVALDDITTDTISVPDASADTVAVKVTATNAAGEVQGYTVATLTTDSTTSEGENQDYVTAYVKPDAGASSLTLNAEPTEYAKNETDPDDATEDYLSSDSTVKQKVKIAKTIKVDVSGFQRIGKDGSTYVYTGSSVDDADKDTAAVKANGFEIEYGDAYGDGADVTVDDNASVDKISGNVHQVTVDGDASVDSIESDKEATVNVSEGEVGAIDFDDDEKGTVTTDSSDSKVGNIVDAATVTVNNGTVGDIDASDSVDISGDDDEHAVTVGNVSTKTLTIDSEDSQGIKTGTLKASDGDSEFTLTGDAVTIGGIDFNYYDTELKLDDFQGEIPAPENATDDDATLSTQNEDDRVTVKGDADISNLSIEEESQITFDGALNVANVDGTGKLVIAPAKLYVSEDASDVQLVLNGSFKAGDVAYTSAHDSIDEDSFDNYGFTVTKTEGSSTDTFKVASLEFTGLTIAPATTDIAKGYSQTFTASAYAPGSAIPEGYTIKFAFDGDDQYFTAVDNGDGTATVTVTGVDDTFTSENKATLTAYLEDADGATNDDYDEGEADIKAVAVPATNFKSDTTGNVNLKVGQTYQFKITSLDGKAPTFGVAGNGATVQYAGATGSDYFYKVTGAKEGSYGVYVNGGGVEHRAAILVIKGVNVTTDTTAVTRAPGQTYQFKITAPSQPSFGAVGLKYVLASKSGNNYFYKVTASNVKGGHGIYVNGVRVAIFTVA